MSKNDRPRSGALALSWEDHRRTTGLCAWLELPLHTLTFEGPRWRRYVRLICRTLRVLARERPSVVYVQNPSLVLTLLVLAARSLLGGYRVIVDAHNEAVTPFAYAFWPVIPLSRVALRAAHVTIVTNSVLARQVRAIGGQPLVLPDRLPAPSVAPQRIPPKSGRLRIMVVATYAKDEPIAEIVDAARQLGERFEFRFTGHATKMAAAVRARLPTNVTQTGFLSEDSYWGLMNESHVVLDLTVRPDCLVCGAYEALALKRPTILSANEPTKELFGRVAVFTASQSAQDIVRAVQEAEERLDELTAAVAEEASRFDTRWTERASELKNTISRWLASPVRGHLDAQRDAVG